MAGLNITPGFQCSFEGCSLEARGRSANKHTVLRHIKKAHQLPKSKSSMITEVGLQTFFPPPYNQLFVVSLQAINGPATSILNPIIANPDDFLQQL